MTYIGRLTNKSIDRSGIAILSLFIYAHIVISTRILHVGLTGGHNWATGEWLINYGGGFVRRGLSGALILLLPLNPKLLLILLSAFLLILVTFVYTIMIWSFLKLKHDFYLILLMINPAGLLFIAWDQNVYIRKEWLGYVLLILLILNIERFKSIKLEYFIIIVFNISIFCSEVVAAFVPVIFILLRNSVSKTRMKIPAARIFFLITSAITLTTVTVFHGSKLNSMEVCNTLVTHGFDPNKNCNGAIGTLGYSILEAVSHFKTDFPGYLMYIPLAILGSIPIALTKWHRNNRRLVLSAILGVFPLFFIAWDYGRWISIVVTELTIIIVLTNYLSKEYTPGKHVSKINVWHKLLVSFYLLWGLGHGGNPLTNGWIGPIPTLLDTIITLVN